MTYLLALVLGMLIGSLLEWLEGDDYSGRGVIISILGLFIVLALLSATAISLGAR